jgi:hypothetical protein
MTTVTPGTLPGGSIFTVSQWRPGTIYPPGSVVQPTSILTPVTGNPPTNATFASGSLTGWTADAGWTYDGTHGFDDSSSAKLATGNSTKKLVNNNKVTVTAGQVINGTCYLGTAADLNVVFLGVNGVLSIFWYDSGSTLIGQSDGLSTAAFSDGSTLQWFKATVTGTAPANAAFAAIAITCSNASALVPLYVDEFGWDYVGNPTTNTPQYFTAVQSGAGTSGAQEPDWTNAGTNVGNVTDGTVTWARGLQTIITWIASALCQSGFSEPTFSTTSGSSVNDNNMAWQCQTPIIADANCPQSKYAVIASSKVFHGDDDIVRFSATNDPTDWTTEADAGFLPTGLQTYGANSVTALGLYRSNLVVFNSEGFQMWQLDEDPANMALLDAMPIGSIYPKALAPVNNDLFFLSAQGVRTMGISAGSGSLSAGDVGMPVDPIIQAGIAYCKAHSVEPLAVYYPSAGQYWIVFPGWDPGVALFRKLATTGPYAIGESVFVYTMSRVGEVGAWSRYVFPFTISGFCFNGDDLCIRSGDDVLKVDPTALQDYAGDTYLGASRATYFPGAVQWQYLDFGMLGQNKKFDTMDIACSQGTAVTVEIGYDQSNASTYTAPFTIPADSMPGMPLPVGILAPSIAIRLSFTSSDAWQVDAVNVYVDDMRLPA